MRKRLWRPTARAGLDRRDAPTDARRARSAALSTRRIFNDVYLIPAIFFFGVGAVPALVATAIFSIPPGVRLTELGIRQVDAEVIEAANAFWGASLEDHA